MGTPTFRLKLEWNHYHQGTAPAHHNGPYAIVRHPIYAGLLLAIVGSAIAVGEWRGVLAVAIAAVSFIRKLRLEERWMHEQFGNSYLAYRQRVSALIPFVF